MDPRTQERVEQWDSYPFTGGQDGIADLADEGFSGAVTAGGVWLFALNGRAVAVDGGDLEDVANASGTAYVAPDPAPPLLAAMKTRGGETRAKYYTNETPLEDVDETLQEGSFTGYVELSEQVLSGDYYLVYYGGRRMAMAYIGNAGRLLTGEEAFERATEEVGLYEVVDVDVDVTDLADFVEQSAETEPAADDGEPTDPDAGEASPSSVDTADAAVEFAEEGADDSEITTTGDAPAEPASTDLTDTESTDSEETDETVASAPETAHPSEERVGPSTAEAPADPDEQATDEESEDDGHHSTFSERVVEKSETAGSEHPSEPSEPDGSDERFKREERWRETRSIPSIDPENSTPSSTRSSSSEGRTDAGTATASSRSRSTSERVGRSKETNSPSESRPSGATVERSDTRSRSDERLESLRERRDALKAKVEALLEEREKLTRKVTALEDDRDAVREENRELSATVDRLESRIEDLEAQLDRARSVDATGAISESTDGKGVPVDRALEGTNLFVRYNSKGKATLETAHADQADPEAVNSNLRLEHHTDFDAAEVTVDGDSYEEFLPTTLEFQFVDWLVETLLYEIRETGRTGGLADLYDAIPEIDRIEFSATVSLADDDTEDVPDAVGFDVVVFDKMGRPLVVANLNDSRDAATREMLERLEETASAVKANYPELAAAVAVTSSFFKPGALEVTDRATSAGILSRNSKLNYVNVSRKQGYHLCLVEARSGGFHMTVPEL